MKRELYENDKGQFISRTSYKGELVDLRVLRAMPPVTSIPEAIMWNVMCLGKVKVYCLVANNKIVHKSYVVRGRWKFRYLGRYDIEIGPCWTDERWRGRGYYPYVLSIILSNELNERGKAYISVAEDNAASIRGITKVGFRKTNLVVQRSRFLIHRAVVDVDS